MAAFFLAEIESIHDRKKYDAYKERVAPIIRKFGGEYVLRSDRLSPVSGSWSSERIVLIRFDSREQLQRCFRSEEYAAIAALREQSTVSKAMVIED
jgi:uncharacterized protein (DUF1330 family)